MAKLPAPPALSELPPTLVASDYLEETDPHPFNWVFLAENTALVPWVFDRTVAILPEPDRPKAMMEFCRWLKVLGLTHSVSMVYDPGANQPTLAGTFRVARQMQGLTEAQTPRSTFYSSHTEKTWKAFCKGRGINYHHLINDKTWAKLGLPKLSSDLSPFWDHVRTWLVATTAPILEARVDLTKKGGGRIQKGTNKVMGHQSEPVEINAILAALPENELAQSSGSTSDHALGKLGKALSQALVQAGMYTADELTKELSIEVFAPSDTLVSKRTARLAGVQLDTATPAVSRKGSRSSL